MFLLCFAAVKWSLFADSWVVADWSLMRVRVRVVRALQLQSTVKYSSHRYDSLPVWDPFDPLSPIRYDFTVKTISFHYILVVCIQEIWQTTIDSSQHHWCLWKEVGEFDLAQLWLVNISASAAWSSIICKILSARSLHTATFPSR